MSDKEKAFALYRPPFSFRHGYIYDADNNMVSDQHESSVCRVRGWGRISYMENPEQLQDAVGEHIAKALTEYWQKHAPSIQDAERKS